jgi:hypothetical protein
MDVDIDPIKTINEWLDKELEKLPDYGYVSITFGGARPWAEAYVAPCDCCRPEEVEWWGKTPIDVTDNPIEALKLAIEDAVKRKAKNDNISSNGH